MPPPMINTSVSVIAVLTGCRQCGYRHSRRSLGCPVAGRSCSWTPLTRHNGDRDDGVALLDGINDLLPIALHLAKNRVLAVKPRGFDMRDEELRAIGVWPGVCHTQDARAIMLQLQSGCFIRPGIPRTTAATAFRAAALHHKRWAFDDAVEIQAIVKAVTGQKDEIVDRDWRFCGEQLNVEFAPGGREMRHIRLLGVNLHSRGGIVTLWHASHSSLWDRGVCW